MEKNNRHKPGARRLFPLAVLALAAAIGLYAAVTAQHNGGRPLSAVTPAAGESAIEGHFSLTDHNGAAVTSETYNGQYRLVFFGFTACPAICPAGMKKMTEALNLLDKDAERVQPLFITLDPARDTASVMKDYAAQYHPRIVGLTGTQEQVTAVQKEYKVYATRVEDDVTGSYNIDHSSFIYLMGPDGKFLTVFGSDETPAAVADTVRHYLRAS